MKNPRHLLSLAFLCLAVSASAACQRTATVPFGTSAQRLDQALQDFTHRTGCTVTVTPDLLAHRQSSAVPGRQRPAVALDLMLRHAGLQFSASPDGYALSRWQP